MINQYTVIGHPIKHSLSPKIHHLFGELTQRRIHYTTTDATPEAFESVVRSFAARGGRGCNVTLPHKERALALCDRLTPEARFAGAVNTIHMHRDGMLVGHNTDGSGLVSDLSKNLRIALAGKRVLMAGAGGAARGVCGPLLGTGIDSLHIVNRTVERADRLVADFGHLGTITAGAYASLDPASRYDIVINATSLGVLDQVAPLPASVFHDESLAYDMMYGKTDTAFVRWAREAGAGRACHGFGMLVEQAADAFLMWEGVRPKTRMAQDRLRAILMES